MHLNVLSTQCMLAHSAAWLGADQVRAELAAHPLGAAVLDQLQLAHQRLADRQGQRVCLSSELERLGSKLIALGQEHDRKARALYAILDGLAQAADDPEQAAVFLDLLLLLFPDGLRVMQYSYLDEASATLEIERRVSAEVLARMAAVPVGPGTLADLYCAWIAAGRELGRTARERSGLQASVIRHRTIATTVTTAVDARAARQQWIRAVRMLLDAVEMLLLSDMARALVLTPLERSIRAALRSRLDGPGDAAREDRAPGAAPDEPVQAAASALALEQTDRALMRAREAS